ncbi:MAG TPA: GGDEF domain-containing protein [Polyangia bacterium]|jgi:diguanylate cyclase (GGDEF)-like protein|nr:GGDEF domain-containing protein [Polyangia bacterium]
MVRTSSTSPAARRLAPVVSGASASVTERRLRKLVAENLRLTREVKELRRLRRWARQNSLTGLPNRHPFEERLDEELLRWERDPSQYGAILIVDIVHLGPARHDANDAAAQVAAQVLRAALRASDLCFRTGGDEFMVLLHETSQDGARQAMARLRAAVMRAGARVDVPLPLSLSIGMASWPADGHLVSSLIQVADGALETERRRLAARARRRPPRARRPLTLVR